MSLINLYQQLVNNRLITDSFWSLAGNVVGRGLSLIAGVLVARYLGKDIFGEYGTIKITILTIGTFSTFGLGYTATKYIAEFKNNNIGKIKDFLKIANILTLVFSGTMATVLFAFSDMIANLWLNGSHLSTPLKILSVLVVFNATTTTQIGVLSGFGCFKEIAKINVRVGLLSFALSVVLTYLYALNGALAALLIVQIINCILNFRVVRKITANMPISSDLSYSMLRSVIAFSTPIALQEGVYSITSWLSVVLIVEFSNYGELGLYSVAMQWNAIVLFVPGILRNVILSHLAKNNDNVETHSVIIKQTVWINFISTLTPCAVVFVIADFIEKAYGVSFEGVAELILLAVFATIFQSINNVYAQAFMSIGRNWLMFGLRFIREMLLLLFFLFLVLVVKKAGAEAMLLALLCVNFTFMLIVWCAYNIIRD